ncbi:MAG: histone deacetylase [Actinobacteria bacterium]|nr:MAG: histone deacetylase [Actinomycetota bacterium]
MRLIVASHPSSVEHDTSRNHPERPQRVNAVLQGLQDSRLEIDKVLSPEVDRKHLERVHDVDYINTLEAFCSMGGGALDMDTIVSSESWKAALTAAGGVVAAAERLEGETDATAFVVARPPGHHALSDRAMGFCMFNNVAVANGMLRSKGQRVAIVDWDVHHGNGTEAMVKNDPDVLYVSLHQSPFYPFEGLITSMDEEPKGTTLNIPMGEGTAGDVYREAWGSIVLPVISQFAPDWILVSAGYDAHRDDPLAGLRLISDDYGWMASELASAFPTERTIFVLEGGYNLDALRDSARATVEGAAGLFQASEPLQSPEGSFRDLDRARSVVSRHYRL